MQSLTEISPRVLSFAVCALFTWQLQPYLQLIGDSVAARGKAQFSKQPPAGVADYSDARKIARLFRIYLSLAVYVTLATPGTLLWGATLCMAVGGLSGYVLPLLCDSPAQRSAVGTEISWLMRLVNTALA